MTRLEVDLPATTGAASAAFGLRLLERLTDAAPHDDVVLAPISVYSALATLREGAAGRTREALDEVLGLGGGTAPPAHGELRRDLMERDPAVDLALAQSVWVDGSCELAPEFRTVAATLGVACESLDFGDPAAPAAVNAWAAEQTRGMIPAVIEAFQPDERLALADAAFLNGSWSEPFDRAATSERPFTRADGTAVRVASMTAEGRFEYAETDTAQAIRLPYGDTGELAFVVVLAREGLRAPRLDAAGWHALRGAMSRRDGRLELPRLEAESSLELGQALRGLGLGPAFEAGHDLDGLFRCGGLATGLSRVLHRARVEVDEQGTRAAAVTVATVYAVSATADPPPPFEMRVDRPFLWAVEDAPTGTLLFLGVARDPSRTPERRD